MAISANIKMMKAKIIKHLNSLLLAFLAVTFFLGTASFNYFSQKDSYIKWSSPDETANYFFANQLSEGDGLSFFDQAAVIGENMVMPRSFRSDHGWLKPVSFLGIILIYGSIGLIFGSAVIPFLTPFFAAWGIIFFYLLIKKIFNKQVALVSAFLLAFFPVYIYYTVRSMFHNVLFIVFLLISFNLLIFAAGRLKQKIIESKLKFWPVFLSLKFDKGRFFSLVASFLGGLFLGLAAITRTSEVLWLAPALFFVWLFYFKRIGLTKLMLAIAGFFLALIPNIYFNQLLYSAPIYGGYNEMNRSIDDISKAGSNLTASLLKNSGHYKEYLSSIYNNIFYFGFNSDQSILMAKYYIWDMFMWLSIGFLAGLLILLIINIKKPSKKYLAYFLIFIIIASILIFYYGSWKFNDNPDPSRHTIGNSYTRYWLPIYLMMMPLASLFIIRLSRALFFSYKTIKSRWKIIAAIGLQLLIIALFAYHSLNFVLYGSEEGLAYLYYNNKLEKYAVAEVLKLTEPDSIIITKYYDKFLFPERRVIMGLIPNNEVLLAASKLEKYFPVYYYNFSFSETDIQYLNDRKLPPYNLRIEKIKKINLNFTLYKITGTPSVEVIEEIK